MDGGRESLIGRTVGNFRIESLLGEGGMGKVYCAVQPRIGSRVAIKVLTEGPRAPKNLTERFFSEARAVNVIGHENIVNIIDLTYIDGRAAIIMEYLKGKSLQDLLSQRNKLPLSVAVDLMLDVLAALSAAHDQGIIHRDLKPANIFVSPEGRAKVLDFGVAKIIGDAIQNPARTDVGIVLGTIPYMAPEQVQGQSLDGRCDLFAVGAVLYECLCGRRPYHGASVGRILEEHRRGCEPAGLLRDDLPRSLEQLVMRSLELDPRDRFADAGVMAGALRGIRGELRDESIDLLSPEDLRSELALASTGPADAGAKPASRPALESPVEPEPTPVTRATVPNRLSPAPAPAAQPAPDVVPTLDLRGVARRDPPAAPAPRRMRRVWLAALLVVLAGSLAAFVIIDGTRRDARPSASPPDGATVAQVPVTHDAAQVVDVEGDVERDSAAEPSDAAPGLSSTNLLESLPRARELAQQIYEDAELYSFITFKVDPEGRVPLGTTISYYFASPSMFQKTEECVVLVSMYDGELQAKPSRMAMCSNKPPALTPQPTCSIEQVFVRASESGLTESGAAGGRPLEHLKVRYSARGWSVSAGLSARATFKDECAD